MNLHFLGEIRCFFYDIEELCIRIPFDCKLFHGAIIEHIIFQVSRFSIYSNFSILQTLLGRLRLLHMRSEELFIQGVSELAVTDCDLHFASNFSLPHT